MNARIVAAHAAVAALFTAVWEAAIAMPAGPASGPLVIAGLIGPPAVASVSLALIHAASGTEQRPEHRQPDYAYLPPVPMPRRAVTGHARRKELSR